MFLVSLPLFPLWVDSATRAKFWLFLLCVGLLCFYLDTLLFIFRNIRDAVPFYCSYTGLESTVSVEAIYFLIWSSDLIQLSGLITSGRLTVLQECQAFKLSSLKENCFCRRRLCRVSSLQLNTELVQLFHLG